MPEKSAEKFNPRMVASFNKYQIINVDDWAGNSVVQTSESFTRDSLKYLQTAKFDEKGKPMDEKSRRRLKYGIQVLGIMIIEGVDLDKIQGVVQVWQTTPDESKVEVRWTGLSQPRISN